MDVLTVLFAGLITHVLTDSGAQRAVLVAAPGHEARLQIDAADVIENRGFASDARGFQLEGEHATIEGIPRGDAKFEASYLRHVPSLMRISDGVGVIPEIDRAEPHEAVAAYLDLGAGTFSVTDLFADQSTFGGGRAECLARTVLFRAPTTGEVTIRTASGRVLRVRGNATLRIVNDTPEPTGTSHFHMYAHILQNATHVDAPVRTGGACGAGTGTGRRRATTHDVKTDGLYTSCSNTGCC
jgi:hypothetical protein